MIAHNVHQTHFSVEVIRKDERTHTHAINSPKNRLAKLCRIFGPSIEDN
jgi:hypothetical protein